MVDFWINLGGRANRNSDRFNVKSKGGKMKDDSKDGRSNN